MMKFVVPVLLYLLQFSTFAQEHQFLNKKEVLVANNVYRMDEYDALDSVGFKQQFPNGYFSLYNEDGLVIKANNYYSYDFAGEEPKHDEYINYYFYNEKDQRIGFIQMFTDGDEPFRIISLKELSEDRKTAQRVKLEPSPFGSRIEFEELTSAPSLPILFKDTVQLTETHYRSIGSEDSTLTLDIYYSQNGLIDSTITTNKCYLNSQSSDCYSKCFFFYNDNGNPISKRFESHSKNSDINPYTVRTVKFNSLGLVESIETKHLNPQISSNVEFRKFVYTLREDD